MSLSGDVIAVVLVTAMLLNSVVCVYYKLLNTCLVWWRIGEQTPPSAIQRSWLSLRSSPGQSLDIGLNQVLEAMHLFAGGFLQSHFKSGRPVESRFLGWREEKDYPMLLAGVMSSKVRCMALNTSEDSLVFTTENN